VETSLVSDYRVADSPALRFRRFGFVYFEEAEPVETVISDPSLVSELGPSVGVDKVKSSQSTPRSSSPFSSESRRPFQQRSAAPQNAESESVFIAGFPPSSSQSEIEAAIADFYPSSGIVNEVFLPLNRLERMEDEEASNGEEEGEPRRNKGYAFVRMTTKEDAKEFLDNMNRAIEDGFKFNGARYPPTASYATAKKASSDRSSSFRGGRGGGRDGGFRGGRDNRGGRNENRSPPEWLNQERQRFGGRGEEY
jgi:RNA recognition motif-containing protein